MTITNNAAYEVPGFVLGNLEANVDMSVESTWQYTGVTVGAASGSGLLGTAALVAPASGAAIIGVLQNNPALAEPGTVMCSGVSKVKAGGTFSIGDKLTVNASGLFVVAATGNYQVARALQAGASGSIVSVLLANYGIAP